jgi:hypothetical protein
MVFNRRGWRIGAVAGVVVVGLVGVTTAWATLLTPQSVVTLKGRQVIPSAAPAGTLSGVFAVAVGASQPVGRVREGGRHAARQGE